MLTVQNTLYVMTPNAYAHLENSSVRIDVDHEQKLCVPMHHVGGLVCFGNVMVSPALMHRLADEGKSLVLLTDAGRFKARLEGPLSGNILLRQAHYRMAADPAFSLEFARAIVAGKLKNSRTTIQRGARDASNPEDVAALRRIAEDLAASLRAAAGASSLDVLRGIEGEGAKNYFAGLNLIVTPQHRPAFSLNGRTRQPPLDRFNALLSFLYAMLLNDCRSACEAAGLDPQLSFLHAVRPGRPALALDLQEEFRSVVSDRLALTLINREQVTPADFDEHEGGAVMLNDKGRRAVVAAWQERKHEELVHPLTETRMAVGVIPLIQARFMACTIRGEMEGYLPYVAR